MKALVVRKRPAFHTKLTRQAKQRQRFSSKREFTSLDEMQDALCDYGWGFMLLSTPWRSKGASIARLLKTEHLLLHIEVVGPACELAGRKRELQELSVQGQEWARLKLRKLISRELSAVSKIRKGSQAAAARECLSSILAMAIFFVLGNGLEWLLENYDRAWIRRFVEKVEAASRVVLSRSDKTLGLSPPMGHRHGYRKQIESLISELLEQAEVVAGGFEE